MILTVTLYIDNDVEYSMYELREEYLNYKPKTRQLQMQQVKKIDKRLFQIDSLTHIAYIWKELIIYKCYVSLEIMI